MASIIKRLSESSLNTMQKSTTPYSPNTAKMIVATKRAAVYIRCSDPAAKTEGYSPQNQEEVGGKTAQRRGCTLNEKHIYNKDIGQSGGTDERKEFQRLMTDARNHEFDIIIIYRLDRMFREMYLFLKFMKEIKELGIELVSATESIDYETPQGKFGVHVLAAASELYRGIFMQARNEGMIRAMKDGKWLGGTPPYGYKFNKDTQKLEIEKKEIPVIKMLFEWLVKNRLSEYKIQQKINTMKIPTKYDLLGRIKKTGSKCWWNRRAIGRIIRNEIYTGVLYYRKYKYLGRVRGENNLRPEAEWIKIEDKGLQIISRELFEKALQQLKKNKESSPRNTQQVYALQHKIICGFDNFKYQCATERYQKKNGLGEKKYYFCSAIRPSISYKKCPSSAVSESRILPPVWEKLKEILANPDVVMQELTECFNHKNKENKTQKKLNSVEGALSSLNTQKESYAELYAERSIKKDFYDKKTQECDGKIEQLQKEKGKLSQLLLTEEEKQKRIKSVEELYSQLKKRIENATYEVKREILQHLIGKIVKTDNKLDIEFNIPLEADLTLAVCGDSRRMDRNLQ